MQMLPLIECMATLMLRTYVQRDFPTGSVRSIALRGIRPFSLDTPYIKEKQYKPMFRHTTRKLSATPEPDDMPRILPAQPGYILLSMRKYLYVTPHPSTSPTCWLERACNLVWTWKIKGIIKLLRSHLRAVMTGYCAFVNHARRYGLPYKEEVDYEGEESSLHLLGSY
ncbi:hypothetical protein EVAR_71472_1 [Eumeta japonica]|uniref:Uncharacterized protein n=1 Tax=Eumeta variegata TaxID=151549 RepID=A0A4C1T6Y4_EUMVA|nr:hypothetical protein EVAR_71472_1 [Eumeta japonica]